MNIFEWLKTVENTISWQLLQKKRIVIKYKNIIKKIPCHTHFIKQNENPINIFNYKKIKKKKNIPKILTNFYFSFVFIYKLHLNFIQNTCQRINITENCFKGSWISFFLFLLFFAFKFISFFFEGLLLLVQFQVVFHFLYQFFSLLFG